MALLIHCVGFADGSWRGRAQHALFLGPVSWVMGHFFTICSMGTMWTCLPSALHGDMGREAGTSRV